MSVSLELVDRCGSLDPFNSSLLHHYHGEHVESRLAAAKKFEPLTICSVILRKLGYQRVTVSRRGLIFQWNVWLSPRPLMSANVISIVDVPISVFTEKPVSFNLDEFMDQNYPQHSVCANTAEMLLCQVI